MSILTSSLSLLVPMVIRIVRGTIDNYVKGEELTPDAIKGIQTGYCLAKLWLQDVVDSTDNTYDDESLKLFFQTCEDTADEGGFVLPTVE